MAHNNLYKLGILTGIFHNDSKIKKHTLVIISAGHGHTRYFQNIDKN
jgi:hypothetical protein